ncbi:hypothetical protein [Chitinophaga sp. YIM B06452]|uniref:hypothetical protein n=1 Tax=Chitinophaga sp. YIM B06452 TaxID=3082158 RepID=UPI0031FF0000
MKFLLPAIVALLILQGNVFAQKVTYDTVGIGITNPSTRLQVFNNARNYYVNKTIPGQTEDAQGVNYLLLHEIYTGTLSIDRHVFGKITGVRGNAASFNRKWTMEVNTSSAYNSNTGSLISYNEMSRLVTLTYNSKQYLAIEISNSATLFSFSFTGYALGEAFQLVTDNVVTAVQAFAANPIGIPGNLSIGTQSAAARLDVAGGPVWTDNGWSKSIKLYHGNAIEFAGATRSFGVGSSGNNLYFLHANTNGTGPANYYMMVDGNTGNIGIGHTALAPSYKLSVEGTIGARKVKVTQAAWSDFVFHDDYQLPSLMELETFVKKNKHLPGIPTEAEVVKDGVDVGEMNKLLLQKIEELTLYIIDLKKESTRQQEKIGKLEKKLAVN